MRRVLALACSLALLGVTASTSRGDEIETTSGKRYRGKVVDWSEDALVLRTADGELVTVSREEIKSHVEGPVADEAPRRLESRAGKTADEKKLLARVKDAKAREADRLEALKALGAKGRSALEDLAQAQKKAVLDHLRAKRGAIRAALLAPIEEKRAEALALIRDEKRYTDGQGHEAVDRLVADLRRRTGDPLADLEADRVVAAALAELSKLETWAREVGVSLEARAALRRESARVLDLAPAPEPEWPASLSEEERACIRAANEHRALLGLAALVPDERLARASRAHSKEMVELGYFDHASPRPENATPEKRVAREGGRYAGENIARGSARGRDATEQWIHSAGHHRNLIGRHHRIGAGNAEDRWTLVLGD